jgi:hypothetical protein
MSSQIKCKQTQLPVPILLPTSLPNTLSALCIAQHNVCHLSHKAFQLNEQHQAETAKALVNSEHIGTKQAVARVHQAAATKEMFA